MGGKTPVRDPAEALTLLDSIDLSTPVGLRDRAQIALMVYSFARVCSVVPPQSRRIYVIANVDGYGLRDAPRGRSFGPYQTVGAN